MLMLILQIDHFPIWVVYNLNTSNVNVNLNNDQEALSKMGFKYIQC